MIHFGKQCIFVHIPKTGGTSIEDAIWGSDWSARTKKELWMGNVRPGYNKYQSGGLQHLLASQIRQEVGDGVFEGCFKFSFVRNPWDKVVSQFHYIKTRPMLLKHMGLGRFSRFGTYVRKLVDGHPKHVQSFEQWKFLYPDQNHMTENDRMVDFVGRFESLQRDFEKVADRLELPDRELPHAMATKQRKPYAAYYSRKSRDLVAQIYSADIELFGYSFED